MTSDIARAIKPRKWTLMATNAVGGLAFVTLGLPPVHASGAAWS